MDLPFYIDEDEDEEVGEVEVDIREGGGIFIEQERNHPVELSFKQVKRLLVFLRNSKDQWSQE